MLIDLVFVGSWRVNTLVLIFGKDSEKKCNGGINRQIMAII